MHMMLKNKLCENAAFLKQNTKIMYFNKLSQPC